MKRILKIAMGVSAVVAAVFVIGPYELVDLKVSFDDAALGADVDAYLERREQVFDDLVATSNKRIVWAGDKGQKTPLSVVYVHGFSANAEEIRPVPDRVAKALGANLYFARLAGHGRSPDAMAGATANDWMIDMAETMAIGRALGDEVLVISTSTGGTISALGALDSEISKGLKGITFVSPNFAINDPAAFLLTFPAARYWAPLISGKTVGFTPMNEAQAANWTESYPAEALFPMAAIVKVAKNADYTSVTTPALFIFSPQDQVVDPAVTEEIAGRWGGDVMIEKVEASDAIEPSAHVIAGDIVSPAGTEPTVKRILQWVADL